MIDSIGNAVVALDGANREDIALLRLQREAVAIAYVERIAYLDDLKAAMKTDAAAQDVDFAKAIARREAMLGEPAQFQQAAE